MCSNCGEALEVGRHACPKCWEPIAEQPVLSEAESFPAAYGSVEHEATMTATAPIATEARVLVPPQAPVEVEWEPVRKSGLRIGRLIGVGLFGGLLVAAGLVALEAAAPLIRGTQPQQIHLVQRSFASLGFAIDAPTDWDVSREPVGDRRAATLAVVDDHGLQNQGVRVVVHGLSFDDARAEAQRRVPDSADTDYQEIRIVDGIRIGDRRAFRHMFISGNEYREEWWIESAPATFRIEFWSAAADRERAALLNVRIARTFRVL
jgi:hypothetical protein